MRGRGVGHGKNSAEKKIIQTMGFIGWFQVPSEVRGEGHPVSLRKTQNTVSLCVEAGSIA